MRFILIDRITKWEIGKEAEATKNVAFSEDFFDDHFPLKPIMPGVLMVQDLLQMPYAAYGELILQFMPWSQTWIPFRRDMTIGVN